MPAQPVLLGVRRNRRPQGPKVSPSWSHQGSRSLAGHLAARRHRSQTPAALVAARGVALARLLGRHADRLRDHEVGVLQRAVLVLRAVDHFAVVVGALDAQDARRVAVREVVVAAREERELARLRALDRAAVEVRVRLRVELRAQC